MKGGATNIPDDQQDVANTSAEDYATNQEAVPLPWFCGEQKIALHWISPVYNQFTKVAPNDRPGKK